jgi:SAM-dependent methyltransferase
VKVCVSCERQFSSEDWRCPICGGVPDRLEGFLAFAPALARQNDGFAPEYFRTLAQIETGHFWFESRNRIILRALEAYCSEAGTFLEIGCGTGFVLSAVRRSFPKLRASGSEIFVEGLQFAAGRLPGIDLFQMDARSIPFRSEFDAIGAFDVLEHIENDRLVLGQMWQALKPGGVVLITVPQHPFLWSSFDEKSFHKRRYTRPELAGKLRDANFEVLHMTSLVTLLLPFMLLSRLRFKGRREESTLHAELHIPRVLRRFFSIVSRWEESLIRNGRSLMVGGTLFAAARRRRENGISYVRNT